MKIAEEKRIRTYELTCLADAEYSQDELTELKKKVTQVITKAQGKVTREEDWGKKEMAYMIKKAGKRYSQAHYFHLVFEAEAKQATVIKEAMNIVEDVIRYLLVVGNE
jgi:small subunit ribosomal protein S6